MDAAYLIDNPSGLKSLYKAFVIDGEKNIQIRGDKDTLSDFNRVMKLYKEWHYESCPKFEFSFVCDKLVKKGGDKDVKAFMNKLRRCYKGEEVI
jgi:hypothetical protein